MRCRDSFALFVHSFLGSWSSNGTDKCIIGSCVTCVPHTGVPATQVIDQLPTYRVTTSRPFSSTEVDFVGPFNTKCTRHRSTHHYKSYLAVYVCCAIRAVHLELTSDLTISKFLELFRRFVTRRQKSKTIIQIMSRLL